MARDLLPDTDLLERALRGLILWRQPPARPEVQRVLRRGSLDAWEALVGEGLLPDEWVACGARGFFEEGGSSQGVLLPSAAGEGRAMVRSIDSLARLGDGWVTNMRFVSGARYGDIVASRGVGAAQWEPLLKPSPASWEAAVRVASDPVSLAQAEEMAREFAARLAPWGAAPVRRLGWGFPQRHQGLPWPSASPVGNAATALADTTSSQSLRDAVLDREQAAFTGTKAGGMEQARRTLRGFLRWEALSAAGAQVPWFRPQAPDYSPVGATTSTAVPGPVGAPYRSLPNPFEPLLEMMALGCWTPGPEGNEMRLFAWRWG